MEIDIKKMPPSSLPVNLPDGRAVVLKLRFEAILKLCTQCRNLGHYTQDCITRETRGAEKPSSSTGNQVQGNPKTVVSGQTSGIAMRLPPNITHQHISQLNLQPKVLTAAQDIVSETLSGNGTESGKLDVEHHRPLSPSRKRRDME